MWPLQMAEKSWIDIETFIEAFQQAVVVHKLDSLGTLDLAASYARARDIAGNRNPPTKCGVN
jgi:hypothetical protein